MFRIYLFIPEVVDSVLMGGITHYIDLLMECWDDIPQKSPFPVKITWILTSLISEHSTSIHHKGHVMNNGDVPIQ